MSKNTLKIVATLVGTAIGYSAISTASMPPAQAAVLTYNFRISDNVGSGFLKFSNSGITGIGTEEVSVSEGRLNTVFVAGLEGPSSAEYRSPRREFYDLAGAKALFFEGEFRGLQARGSDSLIEVVDIPDTGLGASYTRYESSAAWYWDTNGLSSPDRWVSIFEGYTETVIYARTHILAVARSPYPRDANVLYTLADTATEPLPVPEPMTVAGTALALASLVGLKHRKKNAKVA